MNRKLYVGNLSFRTEENTLQDLFAQAGPISSVRLMRDKATGQSRGFAFVEMETEEGAQAAIDRFNGQDLEGRKLTVNEARPQPEFSGAGRGNGGGGFGAGGGGNRRREPRW
jgi:RNA recognition motif-containing protein